MNLTPARYPLIIGIVLSILIHWVGLNLLAPNQADQTTARQPFMVEVLPQEPQRETILPQQPEITPPTTQRQGAIDQHVEKEQAPQANDMEDSSSTIAQPQPPQPKEKKPQPPQDIIREQVESFEADRAMNQPQELPTLKDLFQTGVNAAADIARSQQTKKRPNIESGDEILLNMNQDKLFSFFNRFKKGIYGVWNYPKESIDQHQQGVVLIKIIINRDGSVEDVEVLSGAEHERLNREAIAAIFKGQPYGALPDSYQEEQLTINAYFEYILGQRQPNIYRQ